MEAVVWDAIRQHFFDPALLRRVAVLARTGRQRELWFQSELFFLFSDLKDKGMIFSWAEECKAKNGLCDFKIGFTETYQIIIEVKALQQSDRTKSNWKLWESAVDLVKEVPKMLSIPATSHYLLIFAYPDRSEIEWTDLTKSMAARLDKIGIASAVVSLERVDHSPNRELSIGFLKVSAQA